MERLCCDVRLRDALNDRQWRIWVAVLALALGLCLQAPAQDLLGLARTGSGANGYVIEQATAEGVLETDVIRLTIHVRVRILKDRRTEVPVLREGGAVSKATVRPKQSSEVFLQRKGQAIYFVSGKSGAYDLEIHVVAKVREKDGTREVELPLVQGIGSTTKILLPTESVEFSTKPAMQARAQPAAKGKTTIELFGAPADKVLLVWTAKARIEDLPPLAFVDHTASVTVARGALQIRSTLCYNLLQGKLQQLQVRIPPELNLSGVKGEGIAKWDTVRSTGHQILKVDLSDPIKKSYTLVLEGESAFDGLPAKVKLPLVAAVGARRERGYISISAKAGIKVEPGDLKQVIQVDVAEVAKAEVNKGKTKTVGPAAGADLALKYLKRPISVELAVSAVKPKLTAESFTTVTAGRESLRARHRVHYEIRETGVFRFRFRMPKGVQLLDVRCRNLNTWQVEKDVLSADLRRKAEGEFDIFLETEQPIGEESQVQYLPVQALDVERESGHIAVLARRGTKVELAGQPEGGAIQLDTQELPESLRVARQAIELGFRYVRHPYKILFSIGDVEPELHVAATNILTIEERETRLETIMDVDIRKSGVFELRLEFPSEYRLSDDIKGPQIEDWRKNPTTGELVISFQGKVTGKQRIHLRAERATEDILGGVRFPRVACKGAKKEGGFLAVCSPLAVRLSAPAGSHKGLNPIAVSELPLVEESKVTGELALAFKYLKPDWELALQIERIRPVITALTVSHVELSSNLESTLARVQYEIRQAGQDEFFLALPKDARSVDIQSESVVGIKERSLVQDKLQYHDLTIDPAKLQIWRIVLQKKVKGSQLLRIGFERSMESQDKAPLRYEGIAALGVHREEGYVALAARSNVEVTLDFKNAYRADVSQIPFQKFLAGRAPAIWAFYYTSHPYELLIDVTKHKNVEVITAVANVAWFQTVVGRDGQATTDLLLIMRNNGDQNLKLALPKGIKIWEAKVNGRDVSLAQDAQGATLIPISWASQSGEQFPVSLRYEENLGTLGQWSSLDLEAPCLSVPILRCMWDVYYPHDYRVSRVSGNMKEIPPEFEREILNYYRSARQAIMEQLQREQQETEDGERPREPVRGFSTGEAPTFGKAFRRFEKTMALDQGSQAFTRPPVTLHLGVMRDAFNKVLRLGIWLVAVLVFIGLYRYSLKVRLGAFAAAALVFFLVNSLAEAWYPDLLSLASVCCILALPTVPLLALGPKLLRSNRVRAAVAKLWLKLPLPEPESEGAIEEEGADDQEADQ